MAKKLTALVIENKYKPTAKRREIRDAGAPGLYLIIQPKPTGAKSWAMRFRRPDGRPAKLHLGPYDFSGKEVEGEPVIGQPLTITGARYLAGKMHRDRKGKDVIAELREAKEKARIQTRMDVENNFADLARVFADEHVKPKTRRWQETCRCLGLRYDETEAGRKVEDETETARLRRIWPAVKGGLAERWAERTIRSIDAIAIETVVEEARKIGIPGVKVRRKGRNASRGRVLHSALSSMFGWLASSKDKPAQIPANPLAGREGPSVPEKRDRRLNPDEVRWFWHACDAADASQFPKDRKPYAPALRLLLLTGQRLNEIARMRRAELEDGDLHLPGSRTKNKRPHIVAFAPQARELIPDGDGEFVFSTTGHSPVSGWSKAKRRIDEKMLELAQKERGENFVIPPWRLHDLRRTAITGMRSLGISSDVVERAVNHVSGYLAGVAGVYDHADLMPERREALERWAAHVEGLVGGKPDNVVSIKEAKPRRAKR
ncbi:tyrosine-type recombinase/integrase [Pseudorhodoplanes sp.]|uniref:tyrosine-type recombinase/integrase n=1 Tax=Pseudorhodoplanes sp. TaxID=1934341 RepID=UPI003D11F6A7